MTRLSAALCLGLCLGAAPASLAHADQDNKARATWAFLDDESNDGFGDEYDRPLNPACVEAVRATGATIRQRSRWLKAISVLATDAQQLQLRALACVRGLHPVRALRRTPVDGQPASGSAGRSAQDLNYGESFAQTAAVGAHLLHAREVLGQGVRIAIIDAGFNWEDHKAFSHLRVVASRDFLNDDDDVGDELDEPVTGNEVETGQNLHGTEVLGVLAGNDPGRLLGVAPEAEYLLAKTEDARVDERGVERDPVTEEDRWIAALEWADSLGAQVVNSSLGYITFDDGSGYTYADLDGATALTTRAAEIAVSRGIVVVVSAGNEGATDWHYITVPADGPGVLAVGAVHPVNSGLAFFSSRGPTSDGRIKPDVMAPGQQVLTVSGRGAGDSATPFSLQEYRRLSGTSFAAPIVTGACALLLQLHPAWTPRQVADALRSTATDLGPAGPDTLFGWGIIDVARASGVDAIIPDHDVTAAPFPNPAYGSSPTVHFPLAVTSAADVSVSIFDAAGMLVDRVAVRHLPAGDYTSPALAPQWQVPAHLAQGVYFYVMKSATMKRTGTLAIVRTR